MDKSCQSCARARGFVRPMPPGIQSPKWSCDLRNSENVCWALHRTGENSILLPCERDPLNEPVIWESASPVTVTRTMMWSPRFKKRFYVTANCISSKIEASCSF